MTNHPVLRFNLWLAQARKAGERLPEACALATVDSRNRPWVRFVLLKGADERGWVFFTNLSSLKGKQLSANPYASLAFYWDTTGKQIRIDGRVGKVSDAAADAYWRERPRASQIASRASRQSAEMAGRSELMRAVQAVEHEFDGKEVPRPPEWSGFKLKARRVEFWTRREPRLHHRELFVHKSGGWEKKLLQP